MEDINRLLGGMNQDTSPENQPKNTVRRLLNFTPITDKGNLYSITNEDGTLVVDVEFPQGFKVMGYSILGTEIIVVLVNSEGFSQIGYIVEDSNPDPIYKYYHPVAPIDSFGNVVSNNSELGFTLEHPIDCVSRKLINGHRILYFTDNNVPFGRVDLDNPPKVGSVEDEVKLTFNQKLPKIEITDIVENATSSIKPGVYQFMTRYVTDAGGVTTFGIPTNPLPMVINNKDIGVDKYSGNFNEDGVVNKNVELTISNVDQQYQELEIVAIYYEGSQSVFKSSIVGQVPITGETLTFTFTGPDTETEINLTREELRKIAITYTRAKCIEQKDNVLFLSNLSSDRQTGDSLLQEIANSVKVSYRIQELLFSNRGENKLSSNISFSPLQSPYIVGSNDITLLMSQEIDLSTGQDVNKYRLDKPGTTATASITVDDFSLINDGDTVTIDTSTGGGGLTQSTVIFTARNTPTLSNEFKIGTDNDTTSINLINTINNSLDVNDYISLLNVNIVLSWSIIDLDANGVSITFSGAGFSSTNFSGASTSQVFETPVLASVDGQELTLTFPNIVSTAYTLQIINEINNITNDLSYETGTNSDLPILSSIPDSVGDSIETGFTDYTNEELTVNGKGYKRGEVYSLAFCLLFNDGTTSFAYHIPAEKDYVTQLGLNPPSGPDAWTNYNTGLSTGRLGTYVSTDSYPLDQKYPGNDTNDDTNESGPVGFERNIRHHYIPELINEPHFRNDNGVTYIRTLGLEFEFTQAIPQRILKNVSDIIFLRERRNTSENKSILSQGVISRTVIMADDYDNKGLVSGDTIPGGTNYVSVRKGYFGTEMPFFDNLQGVSFIGDVKEKGAKTNAGMVYPNFTNPGYTGSYSDGKKLSSDIIENHVFFHGPNTDLLTGYLPKAEDFISAELKPSLLLDGVYEKINNKGDEWLYDSPGTRGVDYQIRYMYTDYFGNYNNIDTSFGTPNSPNISRSRYAEPNKDRLSALDTNEPGIKTSTRWNQGGLELVLNNNVTTPDTCKFNGVNNAQIRDLLGIGCLSDCEGVYYNTSYVTEEAGKTLKRYLYDIRKNNTKQYGQISPNEYIPISRQSIKNNDTFITNYNGVFGGDIFISKYAYNSGNLLIYWPYRREGDSAINRPDKTLSHAERAYANVDGILKGGTTGGNPGAAQGWDFRACTYFFVESEINTNYRHRPIEETIQNFFPNELNKSLLLNKFFPYLGNIRAYNTQYSYENNIRTFYTKGSTQNVIDTFENRTIYSETASNDDTLDTYRSFLQSDYYDLPSNTGPIWNSFVEFGILFLHTTKSLWKTFAEPAATLNASNISEVVLGTGSLFARPSVEVVTTEGGYAGTISQFGGTNTEIGYIFPDVLQGKMFLLGVSNGGPHLKELTTGLQTYFKDNLPTNLIKFNGNIDLKNVTTKNSHLIDNPFIGIGINGGYDYSLKRFFLVKHNGFTATFSILTNNWFSFHSYSPNIIIPYDNRCFFVKENELNSSVFYEMNKGNKGNYFGQTYTSELEIISAPETNKSSTFQNLIIKSDSFDGLNNVKIRDDNFSTLQVFNNRCNSGVYNLKHGNDFSPSQAENEVLIKFRNDEYRLAIPRDSVINNNFNIFAPNNIYSPQGGLVQIDSDYDFRERIKGEYAQFKLIYDNNPGYEYVLNYINTIFNINIR